MIKRSYTLKLATPAFLGGALQSVEWRTPPLKALLREWWRVAAAPDVGNLVKELKARETKSFGIAADEGRGKGESPAPHPEVENRDTKNPTLLRVSCTLGMSFSFSNRVVRNNQETTCGNFPGGKA